MSFQKKSIRTKIGGLFLGGVLVLLPLLANAVGTRIYVGHTKSNNVMAFDTGTSQVLATLPVGRKPIRVVASR